MQTARRVIRNTSVLLFGRVLAVGMGVIYVAALARYVGARGMGQIGTAISVVSILILIANFGLAQLIVRDVAADRSRAAIYVPNAALLRAGLCAAFAIALVAFTSSVHYAYDTQLIIYIYAVAYIFDDFTEIAFSIFNAYESMTYPTAIQTIRDLVNIGLSLTAIYLNAGLIVIVLITAAANLLKLIAAFVIMRVRLVKPVLQIDLALCRRMLLAALPFAAIAVVSLLERQVDTFLLSLYRSEQEVGWFSSANTLVGYLLIIPSVFLQAIFPVFSRFHFAARDRLQQAYRTSFRYMVLLGFPLCIGAIATADQVIKLVYGSGFENAALSLRILALLLLWMFGYANGALLNATGGQNFLAGMLGLGVAINTAVALVLIPRLGFIGASIAASSSGLLLAYPITRECHRRLDLRVPYAMAAKTLLAALCMGIVANLLVRAGVNLLIVVCLVGPAVYLAGLAGLRVITAEDLTLLRRLFRERRASAQPGSTN